jgi:hypothetical protein
MLRRDSRDTTLASHGDAAATPTAAELERRMAAALDDADHVAAELEARTDSLRSAVGALSAVLMDAKRPAQPHPDTAPAAAAASSGSHRSRRDQTPPARREGPTAAAMKVLGRGDAPAKRGQEAPAAADVAADVVALSRVVGDLLRLLGARPTMGDPAVREAFENLEAPAPAVRHCGVAVELAMLLVSLSIAAWEERHAKLRGKYDRLKHYAKQLCHTMAVPPLPT